MIVNAKAVAATGHAMLSWVNYFSHGASHQREAQP